jgi:Peptidase family M20/M25/M40
MPFHRAMAGPNRPTRAVEKGRMCARGAAVSKSDFASYTFALRALEALGRPLAGKVELHFTCDEEFGGHLVRLPLAHRRHQARPRHRRRLLHNGCLQLEVTDHGEAARGNARDQARCAQGPCAFSMRFMPSATPTRPLRGREVGRCRHRPSHPDRWSYCGRQACQRRVRPVQCRRLRVVPNADCSAINGIPRSAAKHASRMPNAPRSL